MTKSSNKDIFVRGLAKALEEQWQVDVRLLKARDSDEGSAIFAHKLVLASRSEVLKKILEFDEFKAPVQPVKTAITSLRVGRGGMGVGLNVKKKMIRERSKKRHVRSLYAAADKYMIPHLRDLCRTELISSLNPSNALEFLELSLIPLDDALKYAAFSYITEYLETIANSLEFKLFANRNIDVTVEIIRAYMRGRDIDY